jgi:hypothetical protein
LVFCKKSSLKSVIAASDSAFYELTKSVTKVLKRFHTLNLFTAEFIVFYVILVQ